MAPFDFVSTPPSHTIHMLSRYLAHLVESQDKIPNQQLTRFHARAIPAIDVFGYLNRILKYAPCGSECFIAAIVYMERMADPHSQANAGVLTPSVRLERARSTRNPLIVNSYNIHRLLITGVMVAVKFLSDVFFTNMHVSRVGGLPVQELNQLEIEFLMLNDFNLSVRLEELQSCANRILAIVSSLDKPHISLRAVPSRQLESESKSSIGSNYFPTPKQSVGRSISPETNVNHFKFTGIPRENSESVSSKLRPRNPLSHPTTLTPKCFSNAIPSPHATESHAYRNPILRDFEGVNPNNGSWAWFPKSLDSRSAPDEWWQHSVARSMSNSSVGHRLPLSQQPQAFSNLETKSGDCGCGYSNCSYNTDLTSSAHPNLCDQFNFSQQSVSFLSPISPTQNPSSNLLPNFSRHHNMEGYVLPPLNSFSPQSYFNILTPQTSEKISHVYNLPSLPSRSQSDSNSFDFNPLQYSYCPTPSSVSPRYSALYPCSCVSCTNMTSDTNQQTCECSECCTSAGRFQTITQVLSPQSYFNEYSHTLASDKRNYVTKPYHLVLPPLTSSVMRDLFADDSQLGSRTTIRNPRANSENVFNVIDVNGKRVKRKWADPEPSIAEKRQKQAVV